MNLTEAMCSSKNNLCHSHILAWQVYHILVLIAAPSCRGDPTDMVDNGNFERMPFNLSLLTPFKDIGFFYKYSTYIPGWSVTKSWVQPQGLEPWSIALTPLRNKARYYVSLRFAGDPDGGPLYKVMQMAISEFNMLFVSVKSRVTLAQSNPYSSRTPMMWMTRKWKFTGSGYKTRLDLESVTSGACGISLMTSSELIRSIHPSVQLEVKRIAGLDMSVEVWTTTELSFDATTFINVTIQFGSKTGGNKGPLLDNVQVFEHRTKVTALPINNTATSFPPKPWITTSLPVQSLLTILLTMLVYHITVEVV